MNRLARCYRFTFTLICIALTLAPFTGAESQPRGRNKIEGAGEFGIWLGSRASGNEVDGNDFEQFKAVVADVMLNKGANDNVVTGTSGSVSDPGAGNQIRGLKRVAK